jgi:hypothetical protein
MKEFLLAIAFLVAIFGSALKEFAPDAWAQILHLLGL